MILMISFGLFPHLKKEVNLSRFEQDVHLITDTVMTRKRITHFLLDANILLPLTKGWDDFNAD